MLPLLCAQPTSANEFNRGKAALTILHKYRALALTAPVIVLNVIIVFSLGLADFIYKPLTSLSSQIETNVRLGLRNRLAGRFMNGGKIVNRNDAYNV
jgi:hypothetical protein